MEIIIGLGVGLLGGIWLFTLGIYATLKEIKELLEAKND